MTHTESFPSELNYSRKDDLDQNSYFKCFEANIPQKNIYLYISDVIDDPHHYIDAIHRIRTAGPNDIVYIHLNTPGGRVDTGVQLITAMRSSQAHIVTILEGQVCSMGTLIFMAGDELVVNDDCLFMVHNFSMGAYGKGHEIMSHIAGTSKWFSKLAKKSYKYFMTDEEITRMVNGEDFWFDSEEMRERIERMMKGYEKELEEKQKEEKKEIGKKASTKSKKSTTKKKRRNKKLP